MSDIHIWRGTYDETGAPELRPLSDESVIRITVKQLRALCVDALGLRSMDIDALAEKVAAASTPRDAVQAVLNELAASVEPSAKPFAPPGEWFPVSVSGHPLRSLDGEKGTWEQASWPSELSSAQLVPARVVLSGVGAYAEIPSL